MSRICPTVQRGKLSQMTQDVKLYKLCGRSSPQGHVDDQFILPVDQGCAGAEVHLVAGRWSCGGRGRAASTLHVILGSRQHTARLCSISSTTLMMNQFRQRCCAGPTPFGQHVHCTSLPLYCLGQG